MRAFPRPALNGFVRDEPGIATASQIAAPCMRPARNIAFVLIWNSKREPVNFNATGLRKVKNIFVAVVYESLRIDWFEMSIGANCCSRFPVGSVRICLMPAFRGAHRATATRSILDRNGFDPVNCILQNKEIA